MPKTSVSEKPAYLTLTESSIKAALIEARGDIFVAAQLIGVTAIRLDRAIQVSPALQATLEEASSAKEGVPDAHIQQAINRRISLYRVAGLDALHDLASIAVDDPNSAKLQVKLAAAARLAGTPEGGVGGGEVAETLRALNEQYHRDSPRIRVVRQTMIEISGGERDIPAEHPQTQSGGQA